MVSAVAERLATLPVAAARAPPPPLATATTTAPATATAAAASPSPPSNDGGGFLTLPPAVAVRVVSTPAGVTAAVADLCADAAAAVAAGSSPALLLGVDAEWRPTALRAAAAAAATAAEEPAAAPGHADGGGPAGGGGSGGGGGARKAKPPPPPPPTAAVLQLASHSLAVVVDIPAVRAAAGGDAALAAAVGGALFRDASMAKVGWNFGADLRVLAATFGDNAWPARLDAYIDAGELVEVYRPTAVASMMGAGGAAGAVAAAAAAASAVATPGATSASASVARQRGLGGAAAAVLGAGLDKGAQCSDWEARPLSAAQVAYAALDAHVLVSLAEALLPAGPPPRAGAPPRHHSVGELTPASKPVSTLSGGTRGGGGGGGAGAGAGGSTGADGQRYQFRSTRKRAAFIARFAVKRPVYDNCVIQGASGVPLAYCDRKKLDWYVAKGLGRRVDVPGDGGPPTLRLAFEPTRKTPVWEDDDHGAVGGGGSNSGGGGGGGGGSGSNGPGGPSHLAAGDGGGGGGHDAAAAAAAGTSLSSLALSDARINRCVVCGATRDYTRYHVVPAAYRKHLPAAIKAHRSHDIVLVCVDCHEGANGLYAAQRRVLAAEYGAPLEGEGANGPSRAHLRVRKAARTLANPVAARCMPAERKRRMVAAVRAALAASATADEAAAAVAAVVGRGRGGQPIKGNREDGDEDGDDGDGDGGDGVEDEDEDNGDDRDGDEGEDVSGVETGCSSASDADDDEDGGGSNGGADSNGDRPVSAAKLVALRAEAARTARAFEVAVEALLSRPPAGGASGGGSSGLSAAVTDASATPPASEGAPQIVNGVDGNAVVHTDADADALTPAEHAVAIRLGADARRDFATHGELVVRQLLGASDPRSAVRAFIRRWRAYFVAALAPRYLPPDWSADAELAADFVLWPDDDYERHCAAVRAAHAAEVAASRAAATADGQGAAGESADAREVDDARDLDDAGEGDDAGEVDDAGEADGAEEVDSAGRGVEGNGGGDGGSDGRDDRPPTARGMPAGDCPGGAAGTSPEPAAAH